MHNVIVAKELTVLGPVKGCFGPWNMTLKQSQLVALIGKPGHGRNVALRLLSQIIIPDTSTESGWVSVPSHLRTLYVSSAPLFMDGTLMYNLTFALSQGAESSRVQTVRTLCEILHFSADFLDEYLPVGNVVAKLSTVSHHAGEDVEDAPKMNWATVLSRSQQQRLSLVRAIMFDPRLLCLEGPFDSLGEDTMDTVGDMLSHYVHEGGSAGIVGGELIQSSDRAPRTCVATLRTGQPVDLFDCAYLVTKTKIKSVDLEDPQKVALSLIRGYTGQLDASQTPEKDQTPENEDPQEDPQADP